jgi:hypothetical protein
MQLSADPLDGVIMIRALAFGFIACGILLHGYTAFFEAEGPFNGFLLRLLLTSWLPYAVCGAMLLTLRKPHAALGGALTTLAADLWAFYSAFINPQGSTSALVLLFMPLWNLLLITPVGLITGWLISRWLVAPSNC